MRDWHGEEDCEPGSRALGSCEGMILQLGDDSKETK